MKIMQPSKGEILFWSIALPVIAIGCLYLSFG